MQEEKEKQAWTSKHGQKFRSLGILDHGELGTAPGQGARAGEVALISSA